MRPPATSPSGLLPEPRYSAISSSVQLPMPVSRSGVMFGIASPSGPFGVPARKRLASVPFRHAVEDRVGMDRDDPLAVRSPSEPDGRDDLIVRPAPDARVAIGRDVARVHGAERSVVLAAAAVGRLLRLRVAPAAPGGPE